MEVTKLDFSNRVSAGEEENFGSKTEESYHRSQNGEEEQSDTCLGCK